MANPDLRSDLVVLEENPPGLRFAIVLALALLSPADGAPQGAPKGPDAERSDRGGKDPETQEFLAKYAAPAARIKKFYSHVRGHAVRSRQYFDPSRRIVSDDRFAVDGDRVKLESTTREVPAGPSAASRKDWAIVATPKLSFRLASELGKSKYYVHAMGSGYGANYQTLQKEADQDLGKYLEHLSLEFLIKRPNNVVERATRDGSGAWAVELHGRLRQNGRTIYNATVDPSLGWAVRDLSWTHLDGDFEHTWAIVNTFQGERDGVALLRKTVWTGTRSGKTEKVETVDNIEWMDGPVPDSEFAIASFGIEGVDTPGSGRLSPLTFLSVVIATGAFVLSIAFRVLAQRKQAAEQGGDGASRDES